MEISVNREVYQALQKAHRNGADIDETELKDIEEAIALSEDVDMGEKQLLDALREKIQFTVRQDFEEISFAPNQLDFDQRRVSRVHTGKVTFNQAAETLKNEDMPWDRLKTEVIRNFAASGLGLREIHSFVNGANFMKQSDNVKKAFLLDLLAKPQQDTVKHFSALMQAPWFNKMNESNQQQAVHLINHMVTKTGLKPEQREVFDNTLNQVLPPRGTVSVEFTDFKKHSLNGDYHNGRVRIDIPSELEFMATTLIHEVNHHTNQPKEGGIFAEFMGEYRARLVAGTATGNSYDREEAFNEIYNLLTGSVGNNYGQLIDAFQKRTPEARKILDFIWNEFQLPPAKDRFSALMNIDMADIPNPNDPAPLPTPLGNLNNE